MPMNESSSSIIKFLSDPAIPMDQRRELLRAVLTSEPKDELDNFIDEVVAKLTSDQAESQFLAKTAELTATLNDLESGPLRSGVFIALEESGGPAKTCHALIIIDDGTAAYCVVPNREFAQSLKKGDRVLVDGRGKAVLRRASALLNIGEEAVLERILSSGNIQVSMQDRERFVFLTSQELEDRIRSGEVAPGDTLLVNVRQRFAFDALPKVESLSHYQFLVKSAVPQIDASRDIGAPPQVITDIARMVREEMTNPGIRRLFHLRRSSMNLFTGRPGTGKSLTIEAIWRQMYEIMSEVTGVPLESLPHRVFRLRPSKVLSQWLGQSDKNIDRFFDEIEQLASTPWTAPNGTEHELPVIVILEEVDGLARSRGEESVYDRILTGILQRLDPNRSELKDKLVVFIGTTNEPSHVDGAFLRRIGGRMVTFGRLGRRGFSSVLSKHLARLPVSHDGSENAHESIVADVTSWLFCRNGSDPGIIELTYAGSTSPETRYRRDFLTGALIDRAVIEAAEKAAHEASTGRGVPALRIEHIVEALDRQIRSTADQLSEHNVHKFLDVPDAVRIATVRRLPQPGLFPLQLQQTLN